MSASVKITQRFKLPEEILARLKAKQLDTAREVLSRNDLELIYELDENFDSVRGLIQTVARFIAPKPKTLLELFHASAEGGYLQTRLKALDDFLHGGLPTGSITEIVGPGGSGKTQFCHMLCCLATLPEENGGFGSDSTVLYLDTEGAFSAQRLAVMLGSLDVPNDSIINCVERVRVIGRINSIEEFETVFRDLEAAIATDNIKLIVVDSIAALVRKEFDLASIAQRQAKLAGYAQQLKRFAEAFQIPVVIVNQVTTQIDSFSSSSDRSFVTAALGTAWAHSVNTRLVLEPTTGRQEFGVNLATGNLSKLAVRRLTLAKSPTAPVVMMAVEIWNGGLRLLLNPAYKPPAVSNRHDDVEQEDEDIFEKYLIALDPANFWTHGIASSTTHTAIK